MSSRGPVPDTYSGRKPTAWAPTRVCPRCGKTRNSLAVHLVDDAGNRACVECLTGGQPLTRSVVLWIGHRAGEVTPAS